MNREGPPLEALMHRLTAVPPDFLDEPRIGTRGTVRVDAVVADLIRHYGGVPEAGRLTVFTEQDPARGRNRLAIVLLLAWLTADEWFSSHGVPAEALLSLLTEAPPGLAEQTASAAFLTDPDRREEITRLTLARLDFRPAGESPAQAQDRLTSLSATERARVIAAARAGELRARAIREALAKKAADESADKYTRE